MGQANYYRHSGSLSLAGLLLGSAMAALGVALLAVVYAVAILYVPLAGTVTFVLAGGFGALAGYVSGLTLKWGKLRNGSLAVVLSAAFALEALYVSWASWTTLVLWRSGVEASFLAILPAPGLLWKLVNDINQVGAWNLRGFTPTGGALWTLWGIEALIVGGLAFLLSVAALDSPFCERCEQWTTRDEEIARFADVADDRLKPGVESGPMEFLASLGKPSVKDTEWIRADLDSCPRCSEMHALTLSRVTVTYRGSERNETAREILRKLLVPTAVAEGIRRLEN